MLSLEVLSTSPSRPLSSVVKRQVIYNPAGEANAELKTEYAATAVIVLMAITCICNGCGGIYRKIATASDGGCAASSAR